MQTNLLLYFEMNTDRDRVNPAGISKNRMLVS